MIPTEEIGTPVTLKPSGPSTLLYMTTATAPESVAWLILLTNVALPRSTSAMLPSTSAGHGSCPAIASPQSTSVPVWPVSGTSGVISRPSTVISSLMTWARTGGSFSSPSRPRPVAWKYGLGMMIVGTRRSPSDAAGRMRST